MSNSSPSAPKDHITLSEHDYGDCHEHVSLIGGAESSSPDRVDPHGHNNRRYDPLLIAVLASLTFFITDIAGLVTVAPRLAIFEQIICKEYYTTQGSGVGGLGMGDCKVEPVQSELALINGWREITTAFSQVHAAVLIAELVSVPAGAALADFNPWIPVFGAAIFMVLGILFSSIVVPDIRPVDPKPVGSSDVGSLSSTQESHSTWFMLIKHRLRKIASEFRKDSSWIRDGNILLIMASFFVCQLGRMISGITLQYASAKFHWKFDKASLLVSLRAGVNLFVLAVVIPTLSYILVKRLKLSDVVKDKRITQINGICLIIGSFLMFLAASPGTLIFGQMVFALGFAFSVTARSFLTGMVDPLHVGTVFTGVTTMLYGGLVIGSPMLAKAFQWGLQLGGIWVGLPFLLAAVLFTIALGAVSAAKSY
ncbi:hypothetical protein BDV36DRAFT_308732 [Aspergillus pseudocaelatus]|uniref:Major facilitator superfamily domain-containing protein n=1 Tax=Aspergillus pseudocaelatus TaxID=1825620 RepID=A0ABQ6WS34_9EURO|nr:hypothetical protein BDV36DRAFT_308732 [Aspergillus pseudocaelatus]